MKNSLFRIGISGWRYPPWRGRFYPKGLTQAKELEYASRQVNSIEINGSFYSLQRPSSYLHWFDQTPEDFLFSVKGPRYITHILRLEDPDEPLCNFFASGVLHLKAKLGPLLWQLPPNFLFRPEVLEAFLKRLPRTRAEAAELAKRARRVEPSVPEESFQVETRLRHAMEVRHPSFENPEWISLLRQFDVALVFADSAGRWPYMEDVTSDFIYSRLHGNKKLYQSGYDDTTLQWWANRFLAWSRGEEPKEDLTISEQHAPAARRQVFVYFDNDAKIHAPFDAQRLGATIAASSSHLGGHEYGANQYGQIGARIRKRNAERGKIHSAG